MIGRRHEVLLLDLRNEWFGIRSREGQLRLRGLREVFSAQISQSLIEVLVLRDARQLDSRSFGVYSRQAFQTKAPRLIILGDGEDPGHGGRGSFSGFGSVFDDEL